MGKLMQFIKKCDKNYTIFLRLGLSVILIMHSIPGMFDGGINNFGNLYLNEIGFYPIGILLAWLIKISHLIAAVLLIINRKIILAALITLPVMIIGIILIHYKEGWFVVGGGRNGMEFNFLIIIVLIQIIINDSRKNKLNLSYNKIK